MKVAKLLDQASTASEVPAKETREVSAKCGINAADNQGVILDFIRKW